MFQFYFRIILRDINEQKIFTEKFLLMYIFEDDYEITPYDCHNYSFIRPGVCRVFSRSLLTNRSLI